jgi:hypothetical protein
MCSITLGYDSDPFRLEKALSDLNISNASFTTHIIALGVEGDYEAVLRGQDLGYFYIPS